MYYVYILKSKQDDRLYKGFTRNLKTRLAKHKSGGAYTTKRMGDVELIYYEAFKGEKDAQRRENYLKTTKGKRTLKLIIRDSRGPVV